MFNAASGVVTWSGVGMLGEKVGGLVTSGVNSPLGILVPVGIGIMATFIAIGLVKRVIYTFL
jgi:hypothetical protein